MPKVWVLSEESPFEDASQSGGCVVGVFATIAAAMLVLGVEALGPDRLAQIRWEKKNEDYYEGSGYKDSLYFLIRYVIVEEEAFRQSRREADRQHGFVTDPFLSLTSAELVALVEPQTPEAIEAYARRQRDHAKVMARYGLQEPA